MLYDQVQCLPAGWSCIQDPETLIPYYFGNGKAQWQPPWKVLYPPIIEESTFVSLPPKEMIEKRFSLNAFYAIRSKIKDYAKLKPLNEVVETNENKEIEIKQTPSI